MSVNVFLCIACFKMLFGSNVAGEWVDMPQFSDEDKIYRMPPAKQDHFYNFNQGNAEHYFPYNERDNNHPGPIKRTHNQFKENLTRIEPVKSQTSIVETVTVADLIAEKEEDIVSDRKDEKPNHILRTNISQTNRETTTPRISTVTEDTIFLNKSKDYNESPKTKTPEFIDYLPVELLKNVHSILMAQSLSSKGKMQFLRKFERTLMTEIESRLAMTFENRRKRGAYEHYDHGYGYDDHEEHSLGFPSIEGALMAISFLTFAVYLVRLVMMLFRNMNNNTANTTATTLLLGRKKRSTDELEEVTASILGGVDNFVRNYT